MTRKGGPPRVPKRWIQGPADRLAIERGFWFDQAAAEYVREFLATFCHQSIGEQFAGQPLELLPWQWDHLIGPLYGWKRPDGRRRFREAYVQVGKKNGKSTLIAGLGNYHLVADGESVPLVLYAAVDRSQAADLYEESARMVELSPELAAKLEPTPHLKTIHCPENGGKIQALSAAADAKDGKNASLVVLEELHRHKSPALYNVLRYAGAARRQPLRIEITTAGTAEDVERKSICYRRYDYSRKVRDGLVPDLEHLSCIFEPEGAEAFDRDRIDDPAVWTAANPSLGHTLDPEGFAADLEKAKEDPAELALFLQLRLNLWVSSRTRLIQKDEWDACAGSIAPGDLEGLECYWGLDLATINDLAAFAAAFVLEGEIVAVLMRFWVPEDEAAARARRDRVPYPEWIDAGHIKATPGNVIDYDAIEADIVEFAASHMILGIWADPWNGQKLLPKLAERHGFNVRDTRQGFASLSGPTKELMRLIKARQLVHFGNPVLAWMAGNAVAVRDAAGNVKLDKARSTEKIDGLAALVNALAGATEGDPDPEARETDIGEVLELEL